MSVVFNRRGPRCPGGHWIAGLIALLLSTGSLWSQSSSTSYVLEQETLNSAGATAESAGFRLTSSHAQLLSVDVSSSPTFILQAGFWSYLGSGPVPIVLEVDRADSNGEHVDLEWSGNAPPYDVYVTDECPDVLDFLYGSSSENALLDVSPPAATLVCFKVLSSDPEPRRPTVAAASDSREPRP